MSAGGTSVGFYGGEEHRPFTLGDGRPGALLIHGFMGTPAEMRPLAETLAAAGYTARAIQLPGFGPEVPRLGEVSGQEWVSAAAEAFAELRARHSPAMLVGFSMGGAIAMHVAAQQPADEMMLFAPFWRMEGWPARVIPLARLFRRSISPFEKADFNDPAVRRQFSAIAPELDLDDPEVQQFLRTEVRLPLSALNDLLKLGRRAHRLAPTVSVPTLIIQGAADPTVLPAATQALSRRMNGAARYVELPGDHQLIRLAGDPAHPVTAAVGEFVSSGRQTDQPETKAGPIISRLAAARPEAHPL